MAGGFDYEHDHEQEHECVQSVWMGLSVIVSPALLVDSSSQRSQSSFVTYFLSISE